MHYCSIPAGHHHKVTIPMIKDNKCCSHNNFAWSLQQLMKTFLDHCLQTPMRCKLDAHTLIHQDLEREIKQCHANLLINKRWFQIDRDGNSFSRNWVSFSTQNHFLRVQERILLYYDQIAVRDNVLRSWKCARTSPNSLIAWSYKWNTWRMRLS